MTSVSANNNSGNNPLYNKNLDTKPNGFEKFLNPESAFINWAFNEDGDKAFKSYLNPLNSYSDDPNGGWQGTATTWCDPLMKTADANIGGHHMQNLNPIQTQLSKGVSAKDKAKSWADPGLACATSFIKNEKVADGVYTILNPIGGLVSKFFG